MKNFIFFAIASFLVGYVLAEDMLDNKDIALSEHLDDEDMTLSEHLDDEDMALSDHLDDEDTDLAEYLDDKDMALAEDLDEEDMDLSELDADLDAVENPLNDEKFRSEDCIPKNHECTKNRHGCCRSSLFKYKCKCFYKEGKGGKPTNKEMCTCQLPGNMRFVEEVLTKFLQVKGFKAYIRNFSKSQFWRTFQTRITFKMRNVILYLVIASTFSVYVASKALDEVEVDSRREFFEEMEFLETELEEMEFLETELEEMEFLETELEEIEDKFRSEEACIPRHHDCTKQRHNCCRSKMFKDKCKCFYIAKNDTATEEEMCTCQQSWYYNMTENAFEKTKQFFKRIFG
ncbi:u15-Nephitoxin-Nsp1a_1 [Trichonephila clavata]|uniref:U15-Nephitoxin-Nsp1a_1 n=1 Tax=Trichonephila clavata TaxID=2740835 RepID=A0A8X6FCA4_TRICU|nr:u15-Nephitoxin-Nsp1a_1 [Trichonephila clavata]